MTLSLFLFTAKFDFVFVYTQLLFSLCPYVQLSVFLFVFVCIQLLSSLCPCLQLSVIDFDILVGRRLATNIEKSYPLLEAAVRDVMFASMIAFSKSSRHVH